MSEGATAISYLHHSGCHSYKEEESAAEGWLLGKTSIEKKRFLSGIARMRGGGLPMPDFFGPFSKSAFLVNKKSIFLQKFQ